MEGAGLTDLKKLNVLIIDDNVMVHDVLKPALVELGLDNIKFAENAFYALRLCAKTHFHIVICAFNVNSDKDGFHLLEEMKLKGYVTKRTVLIFLSSETSETLVNSIAELQPDDFWVKPLNPKTVQERFHQTLSIKQQLFNVFEAIDNKNHAKAIYYIERHLLNNSLKAFHSNLVRIKGESLLSLKEYEEAEIYFRDLLETKQKPWVYLGFIKALLKQNKIDEIEDLLLELTDKVETRFATYDLLAQYYIDNEDFVRAYEEIQKAAELAPRNIARNKKVWDLARLNHDQRAQYLATINMAKYAKNSVHDSPELLLNVIRSGIDLAVTIDTHESNLLLNKAELYVETLENEYHDAGEFREQLAVARARIFSAREEEHKAQKIVDINVSLKPTISVEDNLDKVKVFHQLGMREEAASILNAVNNQVSSDSLSESVTSEYIKQETKEREEIHFTPKKLNSMAVAFFKKKKMQPALKSLEQALQLSPKNINLSISLLKVILAISRTDGLDKDHKTLAQNTIELVRNSQLNDTQTLHIESIHEELTSACQPDTLPPEKGPEIYLLD